MSQDLEHMTDLPTSIYRGAFHAIGMPALLTDSEFIVQDINRAGTEFTGYSETDIVGEPVAVLVDEQATTDEIVDTLLAGNDWHGYFEVRTARGDTVFGRGAANPLFVDGEVEGYVAVFIDSTRQRGFERTTHVLNRVLRHDLRNELNLVYGSVQNLESELPEDTGTEKIERVKRTLSSLIQTSDRARTLQQWLERSHEMENAPVSLDGAIDRAVMNAREDYPDARYEIDTVPAVSVLADELLSSVFEVLIENAVVHNDAATPHVVVQATTENGTVQIGISDNGPGVPSGHEELIFGREEHSQLHHGQGMGLFFADTVVDVYGGDIWVESDDERGSTFYVRLERAQNV